MSSHGHRIRRDGIDGFELTWVVDHKYADSRLRFQRHKRRFTNEAGAKRFAKKWGIPWLFDDATVVAVASYRLWRKNRRGTVKPEPHPRAA